MEDSWFELLQRSFFTTREARNVSLSHVLFFSLTELIFFCRPRLPYWYSRRVVQGRLNFVI